MSPLSSLSTVTTSCFDLQLHIYNAATQCRINNGANGAAAPGPPQLGAPHKGFFFCTLIFLHTRSQTGLQRPPDPQLYCTLPPAALVWDTGAPILREKSPPLKFCTRPPTLVIRHCRYPLICIHLYRRIVRNICV